MWIDGHCISYGSLLERKLGEIDMVLGGGEEVDQLSHLGLEGRLGG